MPGDTDTVSENRFGAGDLVQNRRHGRGRVSQGSFGSRCLQCGCGAARDALAKNSADRLPAINDITLTVSGSAGAAGTSSLPLTANPSTSAEIAFAFGAVARITRAPPSFCNSDTTSCAVASM